MRPLELLRLAMKAASEQRIDDALEHLDEAIQLAKGLQQPDEVMLIARSAGVLCTGNGRLKEAVAYYEEAAAVDSLDPYTLWALGDVHAELGDGERAELYFARFIEIASKSTLPEVQEFLAKHTSGARSR